MSSENQDSVSGNGTHEFVGKEYSRDDALKRLRTAETISISPELFEKLYLSPEKNAKASGLRRTFGNPTPIGIAGFILSLTPLACDLLGWRGAGEDGAAEIGVYYGCGAMLMALAGLLEFFLGNTFPAVVFATFGGFWFAFASTLTPGFGAYAAYSSDPSGDPKSGLTTSGFLSSFAFFLLAMGILCTIYLVASIRTNGCFFMIFLTLALGFYMIAASDWQLAQGNIAASSSLQTAGGAIFFISILLGWYLFLVQILASVDFPVDLPVFNMTNLVKGASERRKTRESISNA